MADKVERKQEFKINNQINDSYLKSSGNFLNLA